MRRKKERGPEGPVLQWLIWCAARQRRWSCGDDGGGDGGGGNADGGAPRRSVVQSGDMNDDGDDDGGGIGPTGHCRRPISACPCSSTACSSTAAFGIGSSSSAKEFARSVSAGFKPGAACAVPKVLTAAIAPNSPAIFLSIKRPPIRPCRTGRTPPARDCSWEPSVRRVASNHLENCPHHAGNKKRDPKVPLLAPLMGRLQ